MASSLTTISSDVGGTTGEGVTLVTPNGILKVNFVPASGLLSTASSPPSVLTSRLVIANPRPVPPYLRDTDASACTNASKIFPTRSGGIPTPVSATSPRNHRTSLTVMSSEIENFTATKPSCVNLMALDARFNTICRKRVGSPMRFAAWLPS